MDAFNSYGLIVGITLGVLSAAFSYFNRERYKTLIRDIYQPGNDELRSQLANAREQKAVSDSAAVEWRTKYDEQGKYVEKLEKLNLRLPDITNLTKQMNTNHTSMMEKLTELTEKIVDKQ